MNLLLAPLQGLTDVTFRNVWQHYFSGIDAFYAPYIALQNDGSIKKTPWRDILPEHNEHLPIPQILPADVAEALELSRRIKELGVYSEININLGCPYPMVTNKGRGSALLPHPDKVGELLQALNLEFSDVFQFSVKLRCGLTDFDEIEALIPVLNAHKLKNVILHPRIAKQLYKGEADQEHFAIAYKSMKHPLIYNGDINTLEDYHRLIQRFPGIDGVMLGRGLLQNPLLPEEIVRELVFTPDERLKRLQPFVDELIEQNRQQLSGESHLLSKMKSYIPYFAAFNANGKKAIKKMKKCKGIRGFEEGLSELWVL